MRMGKWSGEGLLELIGWWGKSRHLEIFPTHIILRVGHYKATLRIHFD